MRSLNVKRVAAVAAGAAMLGLALGTALGACPDINKDWVYDGSGNPIVQIAVGSNAAISDGVAAANLAAAIASKAYVSGGEQTLNATTHGSVKVKVEGTTLTKTEGVYDDVDMSGYAASGSLADQLVLGQAKGMYEGKFTYNNNDYKYRERVLADTGITISYGEDDDYHGVYLSSVKNKLKYEFDFVDNFPIPNSGSGGKLGKTVEIRFLGDDYVLNEVHDDKVVLIKGKKVNLGIGQSTTITVGDKTYTVTLKKASVDEATNVGYATVEISDGTNTYTLDLDTSSSQDGEGGGLYVYLQSTQKEYTPGVGGSATLRIGGEKLELKDGEAFPGDDNWKVDIVTSGTDLDKIYLIYDTTVNTDDKVTEITGPKGYFRLYMDGTNADRGEIKERDIKLSGARDGDIYYIDSIDYVTPDETEYTLSMYNDDENRYQVFLGDSSGKIKETGDWDTNADTDDTGYLPLREGDYFIVEDTPVKVKTIHWSDTKSDAYVTLDVGGQEQKLTFDGATDVTLSGEGSTDGSGTYDTWYLGMEADAGSNNAYQKTFSVVTPDGKTVSVTIDLAKQASQMTDTPSVIYIESGADDLVDSDTYQIAWDNPTWDDGSHSYNEIDTTAGTSDDTVSVNVIGVTGGNTNYYDIYYKDDGSGNRGIVVEDAGGHTLVTQATSSAGDEDNKYQITDNAKIEGDGADVSMTIAEKKYNYRLILEPGTTATTTTSSNEAVVTTDDTLPYEITSGVTVEDLTCTADPITVSTGYTFGTVPDNLVITDATTPTASHVIVVGGYMVNNLASATEGKLNAAGDTVCEFSDDGNTLYVAGYTAQDTLSAVNDLIAKIKAL